ncbi:hypothetical protein [Mycobacterium sp. AZCC_0083]|uniref:hypothetical protein n=1 Tax=Mycobacterium sp. AZCC_0083 TaxID=2735882 RepID=UPI001820CCC4|nr:hypothetical protein [Mycobacterium sp. AZCC_0083]MBB5167521.1 NADPH-dependent F420 reductase [Mycobacterium sp. AZCC_0083]
MSVAAPWDSDDELLCSLGDALAGKVPIDCVNPPGFDTRGAFVLEVEKGSAAAQQAAALLRDSTVVAAFHNASAVKLEDPGVDTESLVLGEGDDREACDPVQNLTGVIPGARRFYSGKLRNAHQVEVLTTDLISFNRRFKTHAGIRIPDILQTRRRDRSVPTTRRPEYQE